MVAAQPHAESSEFDEFIRPFENALSQHKSIDLRAYVPSHQHPLFRQVLRELVRIDLEHSYEFGSHKSVEEYLRDFPELSGDQESLHAIAFEEYRLRLQAGEDVDRAEYNRRFGIGLADFSFSPSDSTLTERVYAISRGESSFEQVNRVGRHAAGALAGAAAAYLGWRRDAGRSDNDGGILASFADDRSLEHIELFDNLHHGDSVVAERLAEALTAMPRPGDKFLGFRLLEELGAGSFGRVFLARQGELAERLVVLKISPYLFDEPRALAQLQHTHIAPVYSVHQAGTFQAVCMPFVGTTTLADLLEDVRKLPALPASGKFVLDRLAARSRDWESRSGVSRQSSAETESNERHVPLENLSYVEGVLWLAERLADGLAHAHGRGIIHRDLKPANILLTDDGQPMLLDFNLSEDNKLDRSATAARVGGTLPYMAPEQLAALRFGRNRGDERTDLYSFGLILYELLTGREPFSRSGGTVDDLLKRLLAERRRLPSLRHVNAAISPGAESIVRHCLEPDPSRRYRSSRELCEDLRCQLEDRPLRYAPERSLQERARKWMRRHPRITAAARVGLIAISLFFSLAGVLLPRIAHLRPLEADAARHELHDKLKSIEFLLGSSVPGAVADQRSEGLELANEILKRYAVFGQQNWKEGPLVAALPKNQRDHVYEDIAEVLLLLVEPTARQGDLKLATRFSELAAACYSDGSVPGAVWRKQAKLARARGDEALAQSLDERLAHAPAESPHDRYLSLLTDDYHRGSHLAKLPLIEDASRLQKDNFAVWLILGNCYIELGNRDDAIECFDMAETVRPGSHWPSLCRGLTCLELGRYLEARAAFDEVIRLKPTIIASYYNRALARYHLGDLAGSSSDLTHLLETQGPSVRPFLLRSKVRTKMGDRDGGRLDRERALAAEPRDEQDWTARGLERQERDPTGALSDFDRALALNPGYLSALQNKANVLAEDLGRTDEAVATLDRALELYPRSVPARAGRGVLLARLGRRDAAHRDARESLKTDDSPFFTYQVSGIYALTSRQVSEDRNEAFRLLKLAFSHGFGLDLVETDHDLDAIRADPEFQVLVSRARADRARAHPAAANKPTNLPNGSN